MNRPLRNLLVAYLLAIGVARVTVAAPERCDAPSPSAIRRAAADAAAWVAGNQQDGGAYVYEQSDEGETLGGYNEVRHAGVTASLYQAAAALDDEDLRSAADDALGWMIERLDGRDGWRSLTVGGWASLGSGALMLVSLEDRRDLTGEDRYDDVMRDLGRFLVALQRDDGGFHVGIDVASGEPDVEGTSPYFPGEALWALSRLHGVFPEGGWDGAALRAARFIARDRDDVEDVELPPLNDHWASYGFAEMATYGRLDDDVARYAERVSYRFDLLIRNEAQRDAGALYALTHGPPRRAAALGTWVEGQAALGRLAGEDDRLEGRRDDVVDRAACGAAVLVDRQARMGPEETHGAWFVGGVTRMDDQQHAISGLLAVADLLDEREAGQG